MNFDYNELLRQQLYSLQNTLGLTDFTFIVDSEQAFLKNNELKPNTIYVLTRELQNEIQIGVDTQPIQVLILTEQDSLDISKVFFSEFAKKYNWQVFSETKDSHNIWVKQQYSDPVVLSNFNTVDYGYRSVLYMAVQLFIMTDYVDVKNLTIDNLAITPLSFILSYTASMNTQQFYSKPIANSVKSIATLSISLSIPAVTNTLTNKILSIVGQATGYNGNENFALSFTLDNTSFSVNMKLVSLQFETAPNQAPALRIGFML